MKKIILSIAIYTLCFSQIYGQSLPAYVPASGLVAWYSFTGNTNDLSGNGHNLINHGAALTTDRCGNPNSAYYFNGNNSFISSIDSFFNNGWPNYTISLWFNTDTDNNPYNGNHSQTMFNTQPHYGSEISMSWGGATDKVDYFYNTSPNNGTWDIFSNNAALSDSTVKIHKWTHVALVKNDTTYKMYINGVLNNTFTNPLVAINYSCLVYIGTISPPFSNETFWGGLDDYGVWNRNLSDAEVWQLYNNNCNSNVPACIPVTGLVAWYPFSGNTIDETGNGHNLINHGAILTTDRCGNANSAYAFDGNTTFMTSVDTFFNNGWPNYSVCLWFSTDTTSNPYNFNSSQTMFNTDPHYGSEISMSWGGSTDKVDYFFNSYPNFDVDWSVFGNNSALSNALIPTHTWTHVGLVKSDTIYKMYINGVLDNTFTSPDTAVSYLCKVYVGNISENGSGEVFWGSLDDYGIWNRALSASEVWQVYNSCCTASGINNVANTDIVSIYPNPANDKVYIKASEAGTGNYTITDLTGRLVMSGQTTGKETALSIAALAPAMYVVQVNGHSFKFVKN